MSALSERFARRRGRGFIPFLVAGDPSLTITKKLLLSLSRLDPVAIELGVQFSDPAADGPVIQDAAQRALRAGSDLRKILRMLGGIAPNELAPIVIFSYYNPILQFGLEKFARAAAACRVAGVLVVDLPAEAAAPLQKQLRGKKIDLIFLVAPTTSDRRLKQIAKVASGFIYAVSRTGVTGTARELADESQALVRRVRAVSDLPVAVGFGIRTGAQARRVLRYADAAVVGSRLVAALAESGGSVRAAMKCARQFA
jgi:tryptophan synthase alpha chain